MLTNERLDFENASFCINQLQFYSYTLIEKIVSTTKNYNLKKLRKLRLYMNL